LQVDVVPAPGLAVRTLGYDKLLKKFCDTSCRVGLGPLPRIGDVGEPGPLPGPRAALVLLVLHLR
jgi:hypothetical protein